MKGILITSFIVAIVFSLIFIVAEFIPRLKPESEKFKIYCMSISGIIATISALICSIFFWIALIKLIFIVL